MDPIANKQTVSDLVISAELHRQIEAEGVAAYPNECCGMLLGRDIADHGAKRRILDRLVAGSNTFAADEQYHRFSIDPLQQMKVEREAEKKGLSLLGYYHSHPDHPARPSEYDREHAWPFYSYVIVAIAKGKPADMTSWVLDDATSQFQAQRIVAE
ncbi:MAG TPA: M67 family metallopeptidase [Humisphaera sp.]|nr:M67 family metallopeptidase [Humisphaera sp.]